MLTNILTYFHDRNMNTFGDIMDLKFPIFTKPKAIILLKLGVLMAHQIQRGKTLHSDKHL